MGEIIIRSHRDEPPEVLVALWNRSLGHDPIDRRSFVRKVFLDANFRREGLILAFHGDYPVGFCLSITRHVALEHDPPDDPNGYITAFGVDPAHAGGGTGTRLFDAAERYIATQGKKRILIAPYVPNYFVPGVDEKAYPGAGEFLLARGYRRTGEALAMDALLLERDPIAGSGEAEAALAARGVTVRPLTEGLIPAFFEFLRAEAPADWCRHARQILMEGAPAEHVTVALSGDRVVGYCQFEGSHFGPFGVAESERGKGIGTALLARSLARMKARGEHCAWVVWTGEKAAGLYERLGFQRTRVFTLFAKESV